MKIIISFLPSHTDSCMGCNMEHYSEEFELHRFESEEKAIDWMAEQNAETHISGNIAKWQHYDIEFLTRYYKHYGERIEDFSGNIEYEGLSDTLKTKVDEKTKEKINQKISEENKRAQEKHRQEIENAQKRELALLDELKKKYEGGK